MRHPLAVLGLSVAIMTGWVGSADASMGVGLPLVPARPATVGPPGFASTAGQAIAAAQATPAIQRLHRREHPLDVEVFIWIGRRWAVDFAFRGKLVAEAEVAADGRPGAVWIGPLARAVFACGDYSPLFSSPWVLGPFSALFLLPFLDPRRLRRRVHLDAVAILSLLVSYLLFDHAKLEAAVWLIYPPLIYLLWRMLTVGVRGPREGGASGWLRSERVLWLGLLVLVAARVALALINQAVIDVGYASVIGAHRIAHGQSLYYAAAAHSDTYGPLMYLAYVPFESLFPWHGAWDYLASAHAASVCFDLVTVLGLVILGRRLRPAADGRRLGLLLGWAWAACPFTLLGLLMHSNDGFVAMLAVLSLLAFGSPARRGALLAISAAAKFFAVALLPLYCAATPPRRRSVITCVSAFSVIVVTAIALSIPAGGLGELYDHTIGFQLHRSDVFSVWSLHPVLEPVKLAVELAAAGLALVVALLPGRRSLPEICALAAAVTIAIQLPSTHWFYYYAVWFLPYVFVALLCPTGEPDVTARDRTGSVLHQRTAATQPPARELTPA